MSLLIFILVVLFTPFVFVSVPGIPQWLGRVISGTILTIGGTALFVLGSLFPKLKWIRLGRKLDGPEFDDIRAQMDKRLRIFAFILGMFIFYWTALPIIEDNFQLCVGEKPVHITGTPRSTSSMLFVEFVRLPGQKTCFLYYSPQSVHSGETYEFSILPRSRMILDFHILGH